MRCLALLCILALAGWPGGAQADTTCTASAAPVNFGAVQNQAGAATTTTMPIRISCSTTALSLLAQARVRICVGIGSGSAAPAILPTRLLANASGDTLAYQLFTDATYQVPYGLLPGGSPPARDLQFTYNVPLIGGSGTLDAIVHARLPPNQNLAVGNYTSSFSMANVTLAYAYSEALLGAGAMPGSCTATNTTGRKTATNSFPFTVNATVLPQCSGSVATDMDFGEVTGRIAAPIDRTAVLSLTCVRRTVFNVSLDNGLYAQGTTRRMRHATVPTAFIPYGLYRSAARDTRWGGTVGVDTVPGTGTGTRQEITIHGRTPATTGPLPAAGNYRDVITVTVTY